MDRHFILPLTFAAALHAGLLFGFRSDQRETALETDPAHRLVDVFKKFEIAAVPETEPEGSTAALGSPEPSVPSAADHLLPPSPNDFPIELPERPAVSSHEPMVVINNAPPGVPIGLTDGVNIDRTAIVRVRDLDNAPLARLQVRPIYPLEARRNGLTGEVLVEFTVDENGMVSQSHVVKASDRAFEEAALRAVSQWRFAPGLRGGRAVRFRMLVPIVFSLGEN